MEQTSTTASSSKWYDRTWLVILLSFVFFPVGLYGLWKSRTTSQAVKFLVTVTVAGILIYNWNHPSPTTSSKSTASALTNADKASTKEAVAEKATEDAADRKEKVESQFSPWDGSHRGVTKAIKASMNDPDSYEHVSTRFIDKGDYITVLTQFRGKNAFGGKVLNSAVAKVDFSGNVLELQML